MKINTKIRIKKRNMRKGIMIILILMIYFLLILSVTSYAREPRLVGKLKKAFEKIQDYMIVIATPAAGVAICTGLLMRKFSFGDEERVRTARNLIRGSIYAYAFILCTKFVIEFIATVLR